jgi:putative sterol carrier protein
MSSFDEIVATMTQKVSATQPFGKKIKFSLEGNIIHIDGTANPPTLTTTDSPADVTITASIADFVKVMNKEMNAQMAFMSGKIKLQGDMMAAMALQKIF